MIYTAKSESGKIWKFKAETGANAISIIRIANKNSKDIYEILLQEDENLTYKQARKEKQAKLSRYKIRLDHHKKYDVLFIPLKYKYIYDIIEILENELNNN